MGTPRLAVTPLEDRSTPAGLAAGFGNAGLTTIDLGQNDLLTQAVALPDGGALALATISGPIERTVLVKLTAEGTPDTSFGTVAISETDWSDPNFLRPAGTTAVRLTDGSILVAVSTVRAVPQGEPEFIEGAGGIGWSWYTPNPKLIGQVQLLKFTEAGVLDTSFGTEGRKLLEFPGDGQTVSAAAVLADGSVILAGSEFIDSTPAINDPAALDTPPVPKLALVKLTAQLEPDATFGTAGFATVSLGEGAFGDVGLFAAGEGFLVLGTRTNAFGTTFTIPESTGFAMRFTADGIALLGYGTNGVATFPAAMNVANSAVAPDGTLTVAVVDRYEGFSVPWFGTTPADNEAPYLVRLTPAGVPDAGFAGDGRVTLVSPFFPTAEGYSPGQANDFRLVARTDGGVDVVASGGNILVVQRYTAAGGLDANFANDGTLAIRFADTSYTTIVNAAATAGGLLLSGWKNGKPDAVSGAAMNNLWFAKIDDAAATPPLPEAPQPNPGPWSFILPAIGIPSEKPPVPAVPVAVNLVLTADVTGDGVADTVALPAIGATTVTVTDGATGRQLTFDPYEASFRGGVLGAIGDLDGDGDAEIVLAPDVGGGARIQVFDLTGLAAIRRDNFFAIDDTNFRGGARVAVGDVDGDGQLDVIVGAGPGGGPRVAVFDGTAMLGMTDKPAKLVNDFFAFPGDDATRLRDGVSVSSADVDGDGKSELIFGAGPGGAPRVLVVDGAQVAAGRAALAQATPFASFFAGGDSLSRGGVVLGFDPATLTLTAYNPTTKEASQYGLDDLRGL
jgi:uncharacterized delta-60 repeat protein